MTLPTGEISFSQVRDELEKMGVLDLNDADVRSLAEKLNGVIALSDLRGKTAVPYADLLRTLVAGESLPGDNYGWSMSSDGDRLVVGAKTADFYNWSGIGRVYVYDWSGSSYEEVQSVLHTSYDDGDHFGASVSLKGDRLVVGASGRHVTYAEQGSVYFFDWDEAANEYVELGIIVASDAGLGDAFGASIATNGDVLVVGAPGVNNAAGKVYVYGWDSPSGTYNQLHTLTAGDQAALNAFGTSVALEGDRLVVGEAGNAGGKVYVYDWNPATNKFVTLGAVAPVDSKPGDLFGSSLTLNKGRLVVGAAGVSHDKIPNSGKYYIYEQNNATGMYDYVGNLLPKDIAGISNFGSASSLTGNRLVVGASGLGTPNAGSIHIYNLNRKREYTEAVGVLSTVPAGSPRRASAAVSLYQNRLVVGDCYKDTADGVEAGAVYFYDWDGSSFIEAGVVTASDASPGDLFGTSVALEGTRLVVGAIYQDSAGSNAGKVYAYDWDGATYQEVDAITASSPGTGDLFGSSVAINKGKLVVGAAQRDVSGTNSGSIYVYDWDPNTNKYEVLWYAGEHGSSNGDGFGSSAALDGGRLLVGAPGDISGKVFIFRWDGNRYTEIGTIIPEGGVTRFGTALAVKGNRVAVVARRIGAIGDGAGVVYLYDWDYAAGAYKEISRLDTSFGGPTTMLGPSVTISNDKLILGEYVENVSAPIVQLYNTYSNFYLEMGKVELEPVTQIQNYALGRSTAVSGDMIVAGANGAYPHVASGGQVYAYRLDDTTGEYVLLTALVAADAVSQDFFGTSVTLDGTRLAVGAPGVNGEYHQSEGKVYVYDWNSVTEVFEEVCTLSPGTGGHWFGGGVSLDAGRLAVGVTVDKNGVSTDQVSIFEWDGMAYVEIVSMDSGEGSAGTWYGRSVSLDAGRLVVGEPRVSTSAGTKAGRVHIYDWDGVTYVKKDTMYASDSTLGDEFGYAVSLKGDILAVSAPYSDTAGRDVGKVYVYRWDRFEYVEITTVTPGDGKYHDHFGTSVAVDGRRLVVGTPDVDVVGKGSRVGRVYDYTYIDI